MKRKNAEDDDQNFREMGTFIYSSRLHVRSLIRLGSPTPESQSLAAHGAWCVGALNNQHGFPHCPCSHVGKQDTDTEYRWRLDLDIVGGRVHGVSIL